MLPGASIAGRRLDFSVNALLRLVGLALLAVLVTVRLHTAAVFIASGLAAIRYPYELDFGEGVVLEQIKLLLAGQAYRPVGLSPPYVLTNYPPVFHLTTGLASQLTGNMLATGRGVSLISTLLTSVVVGLLAWRAANADVARLPRALAAAFAGLSFLSVSYTATWGPLMRVDMLAILLSLTGVLTFVMQAGHGRRVYWCTLPFLVAVYTKQTAIAAPAACILVAVFGDGGRGLKLGALLLGAGLGIFGVCNWLTHGQFYFQLVTANRNLYYWERTVLFLDDLRRRYPIELAIAAVAAVSLLGEWRQPRASVARSAIIRIRPVLGVYLITAFLVSLTVGKVESEVNYLIELMAVICLCVAVAVADGFARVGTPGLSRPLATYPSAFLLPCLLLVPPAGLLHFPGIEWIEIPSPKEQQEMARLLTMIRTADDPVLSQNLTLLFLAGKPVEFQPCDMAHLAYQGQWDQSGFVARINKQQYHLIVLHFEVGTSPDLGGFTPPMIEAIRSAYVPAEHVAGYWVYTARQPS